MAHSCWGCGFDYLENSESKELTEVATGAIDEDGEPEMASLCPNCYYEMVDVDTGKFKEG